MDIAPPGQSQTEQTLVQRIYKKIQQDNIKKNKEEVVCLHQITVSACAGP